MRRVVCFFASHGAAFLLGGVSLAIFSVVILCPLTDWNFPAEGVSADFMNFFWQEKFHFFRLPHFDWHTDFMLYPYGVDATFFFWSFEMNAFGALARMIGFAPWGQGYYLLSLAVTFFGVYAFLFRRKGRVWSLFFAFVLTFCNYAAICKYPGHFSHCTVHWGILSVLLDVILVEKFWNDERMSARYVLMRVLVLLLCFGLELGYIAGFACFSFFVTCVYLFLAKLVQTRSMVKTAQWVGGELQNVWRTFGSSRWNVVLLLAIVLVAWVYVPIVFQIMTNTPSQEKTLVWGTNPLRLFHPILPDYNPAITYIKGTGLLGIGIVDTVYAWSAGWSALLFCYLGIVVVGVKGTRKWLPFLLMLAAAALMRDFPVITYFPAFKYARIPERLSPYVLCLLLVPLMLAVSRTAWTQGRWKAWLRVAVPVCLLWLFEMGTAYFCADTSEVGNLILERCAPQVAKDHHAERVCKSGKTFVWVDEYRVSPFAEDYKKAVEVVRMLPGEAIFFFPFSAHGGDGQGCGKYQPLTSHQMQFAARCGKKMNGCYLGRMFPERYLVDFDRDGWPKLLSGDNKWTEEDWARVKSFLKTHDFSAAVINTNVLPEVLVDRFYDELGKPLLRFDSFGERYAVIPLGHAEKNSRMVLAM